MSDRGARDPIDMTAEPDLVGRTAGKDDPVGADPRPFSSRAPVDLTDGDVPEDAAETDAGDVVPDDHGAGDAGSAEPGVSDDGIGEPRAGYGSCEEALEDAVTSLERVTAERDDYLDTARRVQAEFENYRKRVEQQRVEQIARAAESLVLELLPVLDSCDAAILHGHDDVEPIQSALTSTLAKQGLFKVEDVEVPFDPNVHEAVLSEQADDNAEDGPVVAEVLRAGYHWNGRVLRPAMVKVRG